MNSFPARQCLILVSTILGCTAHSALGARWYVKAGATGANNGQDWANAFTEIQSVLAAAASGDEVWVARGAYYPDYNPSTQSYSHDVASKFQISKGLTILGGFQGDEPSIYDPALRDFVANETVLSGDLLSDDLTDSAALACYFGPGALLPTGCGAFDRDSDADVDAVDLAIDDNANLVVWVAYPAGPVVLDGITIAGGCIEATVITSPQGIGLRQYGGNLTLRNCVLNGNVAHAYTPQGAGVFSTGGQFTAEHCTFRSNVSLGPYGAGGGVYISTGSAVLNDCLFESNRHSISGGALYNRGMMQATGCTFSGNRGQSGGAVCDISSAARYQDCTFTGNQGYYGGAFYLGGSGTSKLMACRFLGNKGLTGGAVESYGCAPIFLNCLFAGNLATDRGGGCFGRNGATPTYVSCTFSGNHAQDRIGGIYSNTDGSEMTLVGCILWGNTDVSNGGGRGAQFSGIKNASYCCFEGGVAGDPPAGVIDHNPLFVRMPNPGSDSVWATADDDYGDLHLQDRSPCIDAASNEPLQTEAITTDLDGGPRFVEHGGVFDRGAGARPVADMGAYEHPGDCNSNGIPDEVDTDSDNDGLIDDCDNCPADANSDQADLDSDGVGNVCDDDVDGDGTPNSLDGCPLDPNFTNEDTDGDGTLDCYDLCPQDTNKVAPGTCGCGVADADSDGDGVLDCNDACPGTLAGAAVGADGCPVVRADQDRDGDVDQADFGLFQLCMTGPAVPVIAPGCSRARLDSDDDVDTSDADVFFNCMSGPDQPAQRSCQP